MEEKSTTDGNENDDDPTNSVLGNAAALSSPVVDDLIARAKTILSELEAFRNRLSSLRQDGTVEIAHFRSTVQSELGMLERLSLKPESNSTNHIARSSNLPFLETVWSRAKRSKDLVALLKRVYVDSGVKATYPGMRHIGTGSIGRGRNRKHPGGVIVDVITDGGLLWTKISLITNTRLLFDLAKQGWEVGCSDDEGDEVPNIGTGEDDDRDVPLLRTAKELTKAAKMFRVKTKQPCVQLLLPRLRAGETPEIDDILKRCHRCGAEVVCGAELQHPPPLENALDTMARDPILDFSETLNIDCTILLALVSDFSHAKVSKEPWFHTGLNRQVEIEDNENLLPSLLYPALGMHKLVCTYEAARRMRDIVDTIGTPSEKARTHVLLNDSLSATQEQLVQEMQQWSAYDVPSCWQLPIAIVDQNEDNCQSSLSSQAQAISSDMTAINKSVFLYGWATRRTIITSNRMVAKQIEKDLEKLDNIDEYLWPKIWLCPTARSLVGKEKRGGACEGKKRGSMRLPDPLRREQQRRNGLDVLSTREGRAVEDKRPNGYPCEDVLAAKMASL